jgi:ribosome-associated protein
VRVYQPAGAIVAEPIKVASGVVIPESALSLRASRASGPGGQNVNKVASKVELRVDLDRIEGLPEDARRRLDALAAGRRDAEGRLVVTSQRTRDQSRNLEDAREKVRDLVRRALVRPRPRRPTKPSPAARQRRLDEKRLASARKRGRSRAGVDE